MYKSLCLKNFSCSSPFSAKHAKKEIQVLSLLLLLGYYIDLCLLRLIEGLAKNGLESLMFLTTKSGTKKPLVLCNDGVNYALTSSASV